MIAILRRQQASTIFVAVVVLIGVGLLAGAEFWEFALCAGDGESSDCGTGAGVGNSESGCDHCVWCLVTHGHALSALGEVVQLGRLAETSATWDRPTRIVLDLRAQDIFHPPLTSC